MRIYKTFFTIFLLIILQRYTHAQTTVYNELERVFFLAISSDSTFSISDKVKSIDKRLIKVLKRELKTDFKIVDPKSNFNQTDAIIKGQANKRLIFTGTNSHVNAKFIFYEVGANSPHRICLVYRKTKNKYSYSTFRITNPLPVTNFQDLRKVFLLKEFEKLYSKE